MSIPSRLRRSGQRSLVSSIGEEDGFTLIELMVVLLIMAILLAIAIPTFLGVTVGADDRATQSNLNSALTTAKAAETTNGQSYGTSGSGSQAITATLLHNDEPSITFDSGPVTSPGDVSVSVSSTGDGIVLASLSKSNHCWYAVDNVATFTDTSGPYSTSASPSTSAGTSYGEGPVSGSPASCDATAALPAGTAWGANWTAASDNMTSAPTTTTTTFAAGYCPTVTLSFGGSTGTTWFYAAVNSVIPAGTYMAVQAQSGPTWSTLSPSFMWNGGMDTGTFPNECWAVAVPD